MAPEISKDNGNVGNQTNLRDSSSRTSWLWKGSLIYLKFLVFSFSFLQNLTFVHPFVKNVIHY